MRKLVLVLLALALTFTWVTPALADDADHAAGSAGVFCEGFGASGSVEFRCRAATDGKPLSGYTDFRSDRPGYTFRIDAFEVQVDGPFAFMRGTTADGARYDVLFFDVATPGVYGDEVWVVRHTEAGPEVSFWQVTSGNLTVKTK